MTDPDVQGAVTLHEINADTVRAICNLAVHPGQEKFVAPNAVSIAEAHFSKHAWFRAIYAGETPVGFVMLHQEPEKPEYYLWRFMMDARYQKSGLGGKALRLVIEHVKAQPNAGELLTSVMEGEGSPRGFYERHGFSLTGDYDGQEAVMRLPF